MVLAAIALAPQSQTTRQTAYPISMTNRETDARVPAVEFDDARLEVDPETGRLRDSRGRDVVMRGINSGGRSKWEPYVPFPVPASPSADEVERRARDYFRRVADWGLDTVRLPFSWEALEPRRGEYDESYRDRYGAMIDAAWAFDLRVIVDFHQDIFAAPFCGDGFPRWAVPEKWRGPDRRNHRGWFFKYAFDPGVREAFERFWNDEDDLRTAFESMWISMAETFADHPAVVGFEPMNEPGWGETDDIGAWKREVLVPFYDDIASSIHSVAPDALVFYDPPGVDALYPLVASHPRLEGSNAVFAPHYYDNGIIHGGGWSGSRPWPVMERFADFREESRTPVLVGEFGVGAGAHRACEWLERLLDAMDFHRISATIWHYSDTRERWNEEDLNVVDDDGEERPVIETYARPWLRAVAGRHADFEWDPERGRGRAEWLSTGGISEIRVPNRPSDPEPGRLRSRGRQTRHTWDPDRGEIRVAAPEGALAEVTFEWRR